MITVHPMTDKEKVGRILGKIPGAEDDAVVLTMQENGIQMGYVAVDVKSSVLRMHTMQVAGCDDFSNLDEHSRMCAEFLVKSAASYAANNGAYKMRSFVSGLETFLKTMGFEQENDNMSIDLIKIVKYCGH